MTNPVYHVDIAEEVRRGAKRLDKDAAAETGFNKEDRTSWVNASEIGGCIRKQWFDRNRPHPELIDDDVAEVDPGYGWRGSSIEMFVADALSRRGQVFYDNLSQKRLFDHAHRIAGTPDGYFVPRQRRSAFLYEAKGSQWGAKWVNAMHEAQVRVNHILAIRNRKELEQLPGPIAGKAYLIRVDPHLWSDIEQKPFDIAPTFYERMIRRAATILDSPDVSRLDREGKISGQCDYCPFVRACGLPKRDPKDRRGANSIAPLIDEIENLKPAVERDKELRATVKEEMLAEELERVDGEVSFATIRVQKGRESFDRSAAEEAGLDLSPYTKTGAPFPVLTHKPKKKD